MPTKTDRYPPLNLRSKHELAKRISGKFFPYQEALLLINKCIKNFDSHWYDSKHSDPADEKYIRSAKGKPLERLLSLIDRKVLARHDFRIPQFIFGGVSEKNHIQAAHHLLGNQRERTLLALDIRRFFEQNDRGRVFCFFHQKCHCTIEVANLLADLCCVPIGPKGSGSPKKTLARGFATSSRLAVWCNQGLFLKVHWKTSRRLRGHDSRIAIFVDDIGITASRVEETKMKALADEIENIFRTSDPQRALELKQTKHRIEPFIGGATEHLGLGLGRNKVFLGRKTFGKYRSLNTKLRRAHVPNTEIDLLRKKSYEGYKYYISAINIGKA